jgi:ABC-type dipeptide/oligopeptide/nickel transport system permease subunit
VLYGVFAAEYLLGISEHIMNFITEYWKKSPPWTKVLFIIVVVPGTIAVSSIALEGSYPKLTAKLILILVLTICSWPLMFKPRGKRK